MTDVKHFWSYLAQIFLEWEMFHKTVVEETSHAFCVQWRLFKVRAVYEIMWKSFVDPDRPQMTICRMRIVCSIPKATNTHSEYAILTGFPPQNGCTTALHCYIVYTLHLLNGLRLNGRSLLTFHFILEFKNPGTISDDDRGTRCIRSL